MDVVISAVSYAVNERLTRAAIDAGVHMCDMGGNNDVVDRQLAHGRAREDRGRHDRARIAAWLPG